jgi:hypothetical protein
MIPIAATAEKDDDPPTKTIDCLHDIKLIKIPETHSYQQVNVNRSSFVLFQTVLPELTLLFTLN